MENISRIKNNEVREELIASSENNSVPRLVWCFWAGGDMSKNRLISLDMMKKYMGVPICLVTESNLSEFIVDKYPLHHTFNFLSVVHKSDYLRIYLLHHYGGIWHDIKPTMTSYKDIWCEFDDPQVYFVGKPEIKGGPAEIRDGDGRWMPDFWNKLVATNRWAGRSGTPLSQEMYDNINKLLDNNKRELRRNPAQHPYDQRKRRGIESKRKRLCNKLIRKKRGYPLRWTLFGDIFHPMNYKYVENIKRTLPFDKNENLGLSYR